MKKILITLTIVIFAFVIVNAQTPKVSVKSCAPNTIIAGEETELTITLVNEYDIAIENNINVAISSDNPYLTIIKGEAVYGPMDVDATQEATFVVKVNPMIPDNSIIDFNLEMTLENSSIVSDMTYDFEQGFSGWTNIDADGDGFEWVYSRYLLGPSYGHESEYCMFSQSYDNTFDVLYPDNYLVTKRKFKIDKDASMSFWACAQDKNYPYEHFGVAVSTEGNTSADDFKTIAEWTLDSVAQTRDQGEWSKFSVDLSDYEGQELWLAIRHFNCFDQYFIAVDDIEFKNIYLPIKWNDKLSLAAVCPAPNIIIESYRCNSDTLLAGESFDLEVTMVNKGSAATTYESKAVLSSEDEYVTITAGTALLEPLDFNQSATRTFSFSTSEDMPSDHIVRFNLDVEPNIVSEEIIDFTYSFEDGIDGWTTIDANQDEHTWYHNSDFDSHDVISVISHSGYGHIMSESSCNALYPVSQLQPDDYIVTPTKIGVTKNTRFSFWACAQDEDYVGEHFGVAVSLDGNISADDFTTIAEWDLDITKPRAGDWINYSVELGKYEGMFVWVAIRHFNTDNVFIINVDDVCISDFVKYHSWNSTFTVNDPESIAEYKNDFNIYPNPVKDEIIISSEEMIEEISIYDVYGRLQVAVTLSRQGEVTVDVSDLSKGVYFVKVKMRGDGVMEFGSNEIVKRIVKQ